MLLGLTLGMSVSAQNNGMELVAVNDCGVADAQPFLIKGNDYTMPPEVKGSAEARTCNFGGSVIYAFDGMDINADYRMEVVYLADSPRKQRIVADGNEVQPPVSLEAGKEQRYLIDLPKKAYAYGQMVLVFDVISGPNAIVSELNIYSSNGRKLKPFADDRKSELAQTKSYTVNRNVDVEAVLPRYIPRPASVNGVYRPVESLNGVWDFRTDTVGALWHKITVPGEWAMQGFSVDSAAYATYKRDFAIPTDWKGKEIIVRFDGVFSESVVSVNGHEVGSHLGGMTPFEVNITRFVTGGDNTMTLKVKSESLADMLGSLTQYAAHQLGGITRKVTMFAVPATYISDLRVQTSFDQDYKDAVLSVLTAVTNSSDKAQENLAVRITLDGYAQTFTAVIDRIEPGDTWRGLIEGQVVAPLKWDNEHPNLYRMQVALQHNGVTHEQIDKRIGFREIKISGNELLVNGVPVKLRGVCRHEAHPLTGRVIPSELERKDVELYRAANCNFIRTSHYPPAEEMLDVCDELGMFVELEAPVCWVGHHANENWQTLNYQDPQYYPYILQANMETIHFYRNHPSILFWSMANESYWNKEFAQVGVYMEMADPTRPYSFHDQAYGGFNNQGSTGQIANIHYPGPDGYKVAAKSDRPMTYGEYCHLNVYNRSELVTDPGIRSDWALALAPTWDNMYKTKGVLGGSIWSGIDDIFQMPGGDAVGYGPWGPIDGWRRPKPEYWDMKKSYSPVKVLTTELAASDNLTVEVENRYGYTNLGELTVSWQYGDQSGIAHADIVPGQTGSISIPVTSQDKADCLLLTFTDPRGFTADQYQIPVGDQSRSELSVPAHIATKLKTKADRYEVTGKNFSCAISRRDGHIISIIKDGKVVMTGGPWLMALPLTGGGCYPNHNAKTPVFNNVCTDWTAESVSARKDGDNVVVRVKGSYAEFSGWYELSINACGELSAEYEFVALGDVNPRQYGLVFEAPLTMDRTFWKRNGMWSVYPDDHISRTQGEADMFYAGVPEVIDPRTEPSWSWSMDHNELGSNDFRSTRRNIRYAGLTDRNNGGKITAISDGSQHWRTWRENDKVRFLVADFVTAGDEMFLGSYYAPYRKPVAKGEELRGKALIIIE